MMGNWYKSFGIYFYKLHISYALLLLFTFFGITEAWTQDLSNEEVKRVQRAIFVYNFAQQVGWPEIDEYDSFKIGVLGPDRTILDLKSMAQKRKIFGKRVEVVRFQYVKNVRNVQLLYVNNKYNYDINYILSKISEKKILLVTEDYNYNASMINMVNVGDSFEYEINEDKIANEDLVIAPSLKQFAITSSQKWKKLYKSTEESLEKVLDENEEQKESIKYKEAQIKQQEERISTQEKAIDTIKERVSERNAWIQELSAESAIQEKKYEEKLLIEKELEKNIKEQIIFIKDQEEKIKASTLAIEEQQKYLDQQNDQIKKQETILEQQLSEIDNQKKINWYLIALIVVGLVGSFFLYRSYLNKKKFSAALKLKNDEINEQSLVLESKNKELEQFAYIASHDLQEPLNTISSFIGLISEDYGDSFDEVGKESLDFIQDASVRMKKLIDSLLEYSRLGRTRAFVDVDMNKVVKELKGDFKNILERTKAKINSEKLPIIKGNEVELRLLIQNLVSNGIKFTDENVIPEIKISATLKKDDTNESSGVWEFLVQDNGIGIPEMHKDRIFAIFQRLHSREKYQGTGIGLAHCKKIVESHKGEIWLESEEGKGTTFYFTIPF
ncbi:YfiR/HmsC family protein [Aquimarina sp. 2201CG14-23]|uniref:YfiR/HmsC family protein n=1 Tax=Aquimarina mycalae TaxID=3040073 RepID=UPI002478114D|nr:YfiR/HmsC family protein [Aquimarina sp. 2201CG14-23]MDH7448134.1 YfiR/HmsC family protein [Aquimarina sp. 2201CG14-23]